MQTLFTRGLVTIAGLFLLTFFPARGATLLAHHGWGGNETAEFELTGTVEAPVNLSGPHATMKVRSEGKVWELTLAPPARTAAAGLKETTIPVGATVKVHGHRNKDKNKFEIKTERITWNSKVF